MSKRGQESQLSRNGDFVGSGSTGGEHEDLPQKATAAQMAGRKIKAPKSRTGGFRSSQHRPSPFAGGGLLNGASGARPNGSSGEHQATPFSGSFNFSSQANPMNSGSAGANGGPQNGTKEFSGSIFKIPGSQSTSTSALPPNTTMFQPPGAFSFGATSTNFGSTASSSLPNQTSAPAPSGTLAAAVPAPPSASGPTSFNWGGAQSEQSQEPSYTSSIFKSPSTTPQPGSFSQGAPSPFNAATLASTSSSFNPFTSQPQASMFDASRMQQQAQPSVFGDRSMQEQQNIFTETQAQQQPNPFTENTSQQLQNASLFGSTFHSQDTPSDTQQQGSRPAAFQSSKDEEMTSPSQEETNTSAQQSAPNMFSNSAPSQGHQLFSHINDFNAQTPSPGDGSTSPPAVDDAFGTSSTLVPTESKSQPASSSIFNSSLAAKPAESTTPAASPFKPLFNLQPSTQLAASSSESAYNVAPKSQSASRASTSIFNLPSQKQSVQPAPFQQTTSKAVHEQQHVIEAPSLKPASTFTALTSPAIEQRGATEHASLPSQPLQDSSGNIINSNIPTMATLNSAATPNSAGKKYVKSAFEIEVPPPPAHLNPHQAYQFKHAFRLKALRKGFKHHVIEAFETGTVSQAAWDMFKSEETVLLAKLKRKPSEMDESDEPVRPSEQDNSNTSSSSLVASKPTDNSTSSLFGASAPIPSAQKTSAFPSLVSANNSNPEPQQPPKASTSSSFGEMSQIAAKQSTNTPLFSFGSPSNSKRKSSEEAQREREDGSPDPGKKPRSAELSKPSLLESTPSSHSSQTAQLFQNIASGSGGLQKSSSAASQNDSSSSVFPSIKTPAASFTFFTGSSDQSTTSSPFKLSTIQAPTPVKPLFNLDQTTSTSASATTPAFQVPKFGATSSTSGGFADLAKKSAQEAMERTKDEDWDEEEMTEEQWEKQYHEKQAKLAEEAKKNASAAPTFIFKSTASDVQAEPPFKFPSTAQSQACTSAPPAPLFKLPATTQEAAPASASITEPTDGIFGRITKNADGTPKRVVFPEKPKSSLFGNPSTTPVGLGSSLFSKPGSTSFSGTSQSPGQDNTFKGDSSTPIFFNNSTNQSTSETQPSLFLTAATPPKAPATNGSVLNGTKPAPGGLFSQSQPIGGSSPFALKNPLLSQSLAPGSADSSRATSPGTTDNEGTADENTEDAAPKETQLDLTQSPLGEEDENAIIEFRARASELVIDPNDSSKKKWEVKGVGMLKVLQHKETRKTRILLRAVPSGKIVINTGLVKGMTYSQQKNMVRFGVPTKEGKIGQWVVQVKQEADARKIAEACEENKAN